MRKIFPLIFIAALLFGCSPKQNNPPAPTLQPPIGNTTDQDSNDPPPSDSKLGFDPSYANDLGPDKVDSNHPGYKLLLEKCAQCHAASRPLNAQFVEVDNETLDSLKKNHPELFSDKYLLQIEAGVWQRVIKRMMAKPIPQNPISVEDAKIIHQFLVQWYQSRIGLRGEKGKDWMEHRRKLLEEFKQKYPEKYRLLYESR